MLDVSTLELLAEVSVALAGFSGVVLMLGRRSSGRLSGLETRRLRVLLELTLGVFFLSLIPLVIHAGTVPVESNLRFCSVAMLLFLLSFTMLFVVRNARLSPEEKAGRVRPLEIITFTLLTPQAVALLIVIFGGWATWAMAIYLAGQCTFLLASSFQFYLLLSSASQNADAA